MKGGGRAATLFADDKYTFDERNGCVQGHMFDVKGVGTSAIH
jgi:cytochrome c551/c552